MSKLKLFVVIGAVLATVPACVDDEPGGETGDQLAEAPEGMLLVDDAGGAELADTVDQVRQRLAESLKPGAQPPPALEVMISDFSRYHLALAVVAAIVGVVLIGVSFVLWRRFARTGRPDRRTRRVLGSFGVFSVVFSLIAIVLVVANAGTAADSAPALLVFFEGGW